MCAEKSFIRCPPVVSMVLFRPCGLDVSSRRSLNACSPEAHRQQIAVLSVVVLSPEAFENSLYGRLNPAVLHHTYLRNNFLAVRRPATRRDVLCRRLLRVCKCPRRQISPT